MAKNKQAPYQKAHNEEAGDELRTGKYLDKYTFADEIPNRETRPASARAEEILDVYAKNAYRNWMKTQDGMRFANDKNNNEKLYNSYLNFVRDPEVYEGFEKYVPSIKYNDYLDGLIDRIESGQEPPPANLVGADMFNDKNGVYWAEGTDFPFKAHGGDNVWYNSLAFPDAENDKLSYMHRNGNGELAFPKIDNPKYQYNASSIAYPKTVEDVRRNVNVFFKNPRELASANYDNYGSPRFGWVEAPDRGVEPNYKITDNPFAENSYKNMLLNSDAYVPNKSFYPELGNDKTPWGSFNDYDFKDFGNNLRTYERANAEEFVHAAQENRKPNLPETQGNSNKIDKSFADFDKNYDKRLAFNSALNTKPIVPDIPKEVYPFDIFDIPEEDFSDFIIDEPLADDEPIGKLEPETKAGKNNVISEKTFKSDIGPVKSYLNYVDNIKSRNMYRNLNDPHYTLPIDYTESYLNEYSMIPNPKLAAEQMQQSAAYDRDGSRGYSADEDNFKNQEYKFAEVPEGAKPEDGLTRKQLRKTIARTMYGNPLRGRHAVDKTSSVYPYQHSIYVSDYPELFGLKEHIRQNSIRDILVDTPRESYNAPLANDKFPELGKGNYHLPFESAEEAYLNSNLQETPTGKATAQQPSGEISSSNLTEMKDNYNKAAADTNKKAPSQKISAEEFLNTGEPARVAEEPKYNLNKETTLDFANNKSKGEFNKNKPKYNLDEKTNIAESKGLWNKGMKYPNGRGSFFSLGAAPYAVPVGEAINLVKNHPAQATLGLAVGSLGAVAANLINKGMDAGMAAASVYQMANDAVDFVRNGYSKDTALYFSGLGEALAQQRLDDNMD